MLNIWIALLLCFSLLALLSKGPLHYIIRNGSFLHFHLNANTMNIHFSLQALKMLYYNTVSAQPFALMQ